VSCGNLFRGPQIGTLYTGLQLTEQSHPNTMAIVRSVCASTTSVSPNKCERVKQTPLTRSGAEAFGRRLRDPLGYFAPYFSVGDPQEARLNLSGLSQ
jgi:hypothetical protein